MPWRVRTHAARHSFFVMCTASSHSAMHVSMPFAAPVTLSFLPSPLRPPPDFTGCCWLFAALPLTVGLVAGLLELLGSALGVAVVAGFADGLAVLRGDPFAMPGCAIPVDPAPAVPTPLPAAPVEGPLVPAPVLFEAVPPPFDTPPAAPPPAEPPPPAARRLRPRQISDGEHRAAKQRRYPCVARDHRCELLRTKSTRKRYADLSAPLNPRAAALVPSCAIRRLRDRTANRPNGRKRRRAATTRRACLARRCGLHR